MASTTAMFTALTGLNANARSLDVIGNNIANVNTTAFKSSRMLFSTQFSLTNNVVVVNNFAAPTPPAREHHHHAHHEHRHHHRPLGPLANLGMALGQLGNALTFGFLGGLYSGLGGERG